MYMYVYIHTYIHYITLHTLHTYIHYIHTYIYIHTMGWSEKLRNEPQYTAMFKQTHNTMFLSFLPSSSLAWCFLVQDDLGLEPHFPFLGMWKKVHHAVHLLKSGRFHPEKDEWGWLGTIPGLFLSHAPHSSLPTSLVKSLSLSRRFWSAAISVPKTPADCRASRVVPRGFLFGSLGLGFPWFPMVSHESQPQNE